MGLTQHKRQDAPLSSTNPARVRSAIPGIVWPMPPNPFDAMVLSLQYQFDQSQFWTPQELLNHQLRQLQGVVRVAQKNVPFYKKRLSGLVKRSGHSLDMDAWRRVPILRRQDIQQAGERLINRQMAKDHGRPSEIRTSGSTGQPIRLLGTNITRMMFKAMNLRNYLWHGMNFSAKVAAIRRLKPGFAQAPEGERRDSWAAAYETGPAVVLNVTATLEQQLDWLLRERPCYLLSYPSNLMALARLAGEKRAAMPWLQSVHTFGEVLDDEVREQCRRVWGAPVIDMYSANEIGVIALQCPLHDHYHVMAEGMLVEILDERGQPCPVGKMGRVVLSSLHNTATPLIRYEIGDYAELGPPCSCGRGLPVLKRILGRARNMIVLPTGERHFPALSSGDFAQIAPVRQFQLIQRHPEQLDLKLVVTEALSPEQEKALTAIIHKGLRFPFPLNFNYVDEIPRAASGKYEDCLCEIGAETV